MTSVNSPPCRWLHHYQYRNASIVSVALYDCHDDDDDDHRRLMQGCGCDDDDGDEDACNAGRVS